MKIVNGFLFCNQIWEDKPESTPCIVNVKEIAAIYCNHFSSNGNFNNKQCVVVELNNDSKFVIEGTMEDVAAEMYRELLKTENSGN